MGTTKEEGYNEKQLRIAELAKALGHPARIAIIDYLLNNPGCICGDIVEEINLAQSTVSQHLKELKTVGIIQGDIEGKKVCYCIDPIVWEEALEVFQTLFSIKSPISNNCC